MSLYNRSSLIQVPSLYKDGTLVSTIPEDRSGDFTVARGSNLAATRVGEDGYIKKGYENLLYPSNDFSVWNKTRTSVTSGQAGYDGSNDAWLLEAIVTSQCWISKSHSATGICSFSVYAKANTATGLIVALAGTSGTGYANFDLTNGVTGSVTGSGVASSIESVGDGWYRCSMFTTNTTITIPYIYVIDNVSTSSVTAGNSIYIQDAQLNQGLVAYPYLETTDSPAQGGLLENTPRVDWSNGVPAVLVEEQRTNDVTYSEYFGSAYTLFNSTLTDNASLSPEGLLNAALLTKSNTSTAILRKNIFYNTTGQKLTQSCFVKSNGVTEVSLVNNIVGQGKTFNIETGAVVGDAGAAPDAYGIEDYGNGWYRIWISITLVSASVLFSLNAIGDTGDGVYVYGFQSEQDATYPSSYIPTYGTTQTRSNEVISDNFDIPTTATIYNSFYSDTAETVFVLDQVFNVAEGLNKVAIAFSPTAVKISVGGSIVANATGTYDTTALSNIQLGSNNGTDYSNAPISGFYVFPEFLTDEELNSLTD